ncbi:uncharacterized protein BDZ99DRAFT_460982 [Mytilinidion resinicola]|uniref:Uncharacterized protein n=1 Tax=Mytilinidion resinicola TaxID=574789 RepID=A0A6A6YUP8_9PEZI|nr:uncharacterized protein BDZ99DRAFT_460982 [Mytilinidion resinicola]KAF2812249.1 hypothetical protein BDZ99DRAFT_460982 [Mytilinidion resinicola]
MKRKPSRCPHRVSGSGVLVAAVGMPDPPFDAGLLYHAFEGLLPPAYEALMPSMADGEHGTSEMKRVTSIAMGLSERGDQEDRRRTLRSLFGSYKYITEAPACFFVDDICDMYPNVRLILNTRSAKKGPSHRHEVKKLFGLPMQAATHTADRLNTATGSKRAVYTACRDRFLQMRYGVSSVHDHRLIKRHNAWVRAVAKRKNVELLEWNEDDGWGPLCAFLGWEEPRIAFEPSTSRKIVSKAIRFAIS